MVYFDEEPNRSTAIVWYLAEICRLLHGLPSRVWGKEPPGDLKTSDFLYKFKTRLEVIIEEDRKPKKTPEQLEQEQIQGIRDSITTWTGALGINIPEGVL